MRNPIFAIFAAVLLPLCANAQDKAVGVWKMNSEKTTFPNPPRSITMTLEKRGPENNQRKARQASDLN